MIKFIVQGQPQGKARARSRIVTARDGKQFTSHYTPKKTREYEDYIGWCAKKAMQHQQQRLTLKACELFITCYFEIPKSWPKWKRELAVAGQVAPTTKPDLDNIEKAVKDALNDIVWGDDCQVIKSEKTKLYSEEPRIEVIVRERSQYTAQIKHRPEASEQLFA